MNGINPATRRVLRSISAVWLISLSCVLLPWLAHAQQTQIIVWGINLAGQYDVPASLTNATAIAVNGYSLAALRADGSVAEWGNGAQDPGVSNLVSITTGWSHGLGLRSDGSIVGWGDNSYGEITVPAGLTNAIALAASSYFSYALRSDGTVLGWGDNPSGVLNPPPGLSNVVSIAAGEYTVLALLVDGTVVEWGDWTPPAGLSNVVAIAAGNGIYEALLFDGTVVTWGVYTPDPVDVTNVTAVAAGGGHALSLHPDGTVSAWGCDCGGAIAVPASLTNVVAIAAGGSDGYDLSMALIGLPHPPPPALSIGFRNNVVTLNLAGAIRRHYVIEQTTVLGPNAQWTFAQNVLLGASPQPVFPLTGDNAGARFYRARLIP